MTDLALKSFSTLTAVDVTSFKLPMENSKYVSASANVITDGMRLEISYTFKNYGSTTV